MLRVTVKVIRGAVECLVEGDSNLTLHNLPTALFFLASRSFFFACFCNQAVKAGCWSPWNGGAAIVSTMNHSFGRNTLSPIMPILGLLP